jgi:hypothetical protein
MRRISCGGASNRQQQQAAAWVVSCSMDNLRNTGAVLVLSGAAAHKLVCYRITKCQINLDDYLMINLGSILVVNATLVVANVLTCNNHSPR